MSPPVPGHIRLSPPTVVGSRGGRGWGGATIRALGNTEVAVSGDPRHPPSSTSELISSLQLPL